MLAIILHTLLYIKKEQKQSGKEGQKRRRNGRGRNRAKDAADILASSSSLFRSVCRPHRPNHRQRSPSHQIAPSGMDGRPPRPLLGDVIDTERTATNRGAAPRRSAILTDSCLRPASCCFFPSSSFSRSSLLPDLFRSLFPDVLPASSCPGRW